MLDKTFALLQTLVGTKVFALEKAEGGAYSGNLGDEVTSAYRLWVDADAEVKALRTLPRIICLCGSTRFRDKILELSERYTLGGNIVLAPNVFGREPADDGKPEDMQVIDEQAKSLLDALHFRKIDLSDQIHVVNVGGYLGKSTHNAIKYAVRRGKVVSFTEDKVIPWDMHHDDPVSITHYMGAVRKRIELEGGSQD